MRNEIAQLWIQLGIMHNRTLTKPVVDMMLDAVSDLEELTVMETLRKWAATESRFPLPADLRNKIIPAINDADTAQHVSNLILSSIPRFGYVNPDAARKHIGELGWEVVRLMGGWQQICENTNCDNETTLRAQMRGLAETVSKKAKRGDLHIAPALPSPEQSALRLSLKGIE